MSASPARPPVFMKVPPMPPKPAPTPVLSHYDRALAEWVLKWLPFGGPRCDDTFEQFGLRQPEAVRRVMEMSDAHHASSLPAPDRKLITAIGTQRLRLRTLLELLDNSVTPPCQ